MADDKIILDGLQDIVDIIVNEGKARLIQQGHVAFGEGINSLDTIVFKTVDAFVGQVYGKGYLLSQDAGIRPENYAKTNNNKGLIKRLTDWIRQKNIVIAMVKKNGKPLSPSRQTAKNLAYAIVKTHKLVGMHSYNKQRDTSKQGWLTDTVTANQAEIRAIIESVGFKYFDSIIESAVKEFNRNNK
jgi:hypothetical protein